MLNYTPPHQRQNISSIELDIFEWSNNGLITSSTIDPINIVRIGSDTILKNKLQA